MTAFATQSNIDMNGPGLLGSDVAGSSRRKSKRITIGTGLTLSGGVLSNSLDLSGYVQKTSSTGSLILPSGTTAERDVSPAAGYSRWNTTTSRFERWTGSVWENYVRLSGDTMTGALSLGSNGLTCGAITSSDNFTFPNSGTYAIQNASSTYGISLTSGAGGLLRSIGSFGIGTNNDVIFARAAAGVLADRNGINAQCFLLSKTYTSDSSQEAFMWDAAKQISGKLGLYSYRGSSGGSNYPIQIGMLAADGTTFSGMSVGTDGTVRTSSMLFGDTSSADYGVISATGSRFLIGRKSTSKQVFTLWANDGIFTILRGGGVYWSGSTSSSEGGGFTASVISNAAGLVEIGDGAGGAGKLNCGQLTQVPPSSLTLATNGQFSVEMTSNTAGNLVYRGSDGTTRRMALVFV